MSGNLRTYESLDDLAYHLRQIKPIYKFDTNFAGRSYEQALDYLSTDYTANQERINQVMDEMEVSDIFTTGVPMPERHYFGSRPNVGAYLAGLPKNMMRRVESENSSLSAPISIFVDAIVSAGVDQATITKRGVAVCALALALKTFRPVSVYMVFAMKNKQTQCVKVQIAENTFDLGRMDFCFSTNDYCRRLMFAEFENMDGPCDGYIGWGWGSYPGSATYDQKSRETFGITNNDIYITGGYLNDKNFLNNPVQWVKDMVEKYKYFEQED